MNIIILDIDNCVSGDGDRIRFIRKGEADPDKKYHDYHSLALMDKPGNAQLFRRHLWSEELRSKSPIIVFSTARPEAWRTMTKAWLGMHKIEYNRLYMRPEGMHESAVYVKRHLLKQILTDFRVSTKNIVGAYDDRQDIIAMYKEAGIKNAQVKFIHTNHIEQ